jgi:hypothetical protein
VGVSLQVGQTKAAGLSAGPGRSGEDKIEALKEVCE